MRNFSRLTAAMLIGVAGLAGVASPARSAEKILIPLGELNVDIAVSDIEAYVKTGQSSPQFSQMISNLPPEKAQQFKTLLGTQLWLPPKALKGVLKTPIGQGLLGQMGEVLKPPPGARISSTQAWQKAIDKAADDNGRFSLVDLIRAYPTKEVVFDMAAAQQKMEMFQSLKGNVQGIIPGGKGSSEANSNNLAPLDNSDNQNNRSGNPLGLSSNQLGGLGQSLMGILNSAQNLMQENRSPGNSSPTLPKGLSTRPGDLMQLLQPFLNMIPGKN
jgi:Alpha/beta hydrolase of unknown function (DUF1400)